MDEETTRQFKFVRLDCVFLRLRRVCFGRRIHLCIDGYAQGAEPAAAFSVLRFWRSRGRSRPGATFFPRPALGSEVAVYGTAICYFGLGQSIWGNPNSLGAAMSIGLFPVLFWDGSIAKGR